MIVADIDLLPSHLVELLCDIRLEADIEVVRIVQGPTTRLVHESWHAPCSLHGGTITVDVRRWSGANTLSEGRLQIQKETNVSVGLSEVLLDNALVALDEVGFCRICI